MVAKITVPKNIRRALNYNEQKTKEGVAKCIYAHNFLKDVERLNFYEKLYRFEDLIALNKRATTNTIHISLNFGLTENLGRETLVQIATSYMEKLGFADQPYLVYEHLDAGHPHIHIVSTNIQNGGKRISLHNIGKNQSNTARKELEIAYNLQKAEEQGKSQREEFIGINVPKVAYGRSATKRGITSVLDAVLLSYKYASLAELNAVLKLFNVTADKGKEGSVIHKKGGLVYRVLDDEGNKIGVPIKASSIYSKPTLRYLEKQFRENEAQKPSFKKNLKASIDWVLIKPPKSLNAFKNALAKEKVILVIRQNEGGTIYGLTYIDQNTKCVFNGSGIGKEYSAQAILQKLGNAQTHARVQEQLENKIATPDPSDFLINEKKSPDNEFTRMVEDIIRPVEELPYVPYDLKKRRRKKQSKNI